MVTEGRLLEKACKRYNISKERLAAESGLARYTIYKTDCPDCKLTMTTWRKINRAMKRMIEDPTSIRSIELIVFNDGYKRNPSTAQLIIAARKKYSITQNELSLLSGVSIATIQRLEKSRSTAPQGSTWDKLSNTILSLESNPLLIDEIHDIGMKDSSSLEPEEIIDRIDLFTQTAGSSLALCNIIYKKCQEGYMPVNFSMNPIMEEKDTIVMRTSLQNARKVFELINMWPSMTGRAYFNLPQTKLASLSGVPISNIQKVETNVRKCSAEMNSQFKELFLALLNNSSYTRKDLFPKTAAGWNKFYPTQSIVDGLSLLEKAGEEKCYILFSVSGRRGCCPRGYMKEEQKSEVENLCIDGKFIAMESSIASAKKMFNSINSYFNI